MTTVAIGDIHGMYDMLDHLLVEINAFSIRERGIGHVQSLSFSATTWIAVLIHDVWFGVSGRCKVSSSSVFAEITRT